MMKKAILVFLPLSFCIEILVLTVFLSFQEYVPIEIPKLNGSFGINVTVSRLRDRPIYLFYFSEKFVVKNKKPVPL